MAEPRPLSEFIPTLRLDEIAGRIRLSLDGFVSAEGPTSQEAADELVRKMLVTVMAPGTLSTAASPPKELLLRDNYFRATVRDRGRRQDRRAR
jgi:hypothetical protein